MKNLKLFKKLLVLLVVLLTWNAYAYAGTRRVYFDYSAVSWWKNSTTIADPNNTNYVVCHAWNGSGSTDYEMHAVAGETDLAYCDINDSYTDLCFGRGTLAGSGWWNSTANRSDVGTNNRFKVKNATGEWGDDKGKYLWADSGAGVRWAPGSTIDGLIDINNPHNQAFSFSGSTGTYSVALSAHCTYQFKILEGTTAYGLDNNVFTGPISNYASSTSGYAYRLATAGAGTYTFTWDNSTKKLSISFPDVTHPTIDYCYLYDHGWGYERQYVHVWNSSTSIASTTWPGTKVPNQTTINGGTYFICAPGDYANFQFSNGLDKGYKTDDLARSECYGKGMQHDGSSWGWRTFSFTVTLDAQNSDAGSTNPSNPTVEFNGAALSGSDGAVTPPTRTGYTFGGYWNTSACNDKMVIAANGAWQGSVAGYTDSGRKWIHDGGSATLYAKWTQIMVSGITLSPSSATIAVGATQTIEPTVTPATALDKAVTWESSDPSVATVSSSGVVTGVAPGTATITATAHDGSGVTQTCSITVKYKVTYANGGATGDLPDDALYASGATVNIPGKGDLAKAGYTFVGWSDGTTLFLEGQSFNISANTTLTAVWNGESCTEYEVLLSNATQEASTAPKGQYITGKGKIMRKSDGSDKTDLTTADAACHSSTKYFYTGSGLIGLQTYNAINKVTVYGIPSSDRTLSSIKTGSATNAYGSDIKGSCTVKMNGSAWTGSEAWVRDVCGELEITFPNTLAANTFIEITLSGNANIYGALFENCASSGYKVSFKDKKGFAGTSTLPDDISGIPSGLKIKQPTDPTATGYTFGGWYDDEDCSDGHEINYGTMTISADKNIYAKWTAKQCTVSFDNNGGTGGTNTVTATYDLALPSKASDLPTKTGYTFDGYWDAETDNDGTGTQYYKANGTSKINWDKNTTENTMLYAKWNLNSHTLTWVLNGGTVTTAGTQAAKDATGSPSGSVDYGATVTAPIVEKTGYNFSAWDPTVVSPMPDADKSYSAQWTAQKYDITYYDGGASDEIAFTGNHMPSYPTKHTYNSATTLKKASKAGYVFDGWYKEYSKENNTNLSIGATAYTANFNLYAKWTAMTMANMVSGTLYKASDMVPDGLTISGTKYYYPGVSNGELFNLVGTGTSDASTGPMGAQTMESASVGGTSFDKYLDFCGAASVASYVPSSRAIQFKVSATGKLTIYCKKPSVLYLSNGSSATQLDASETGTAKIEMAVSTGTYYLYATGSGAELYGLQFDNTYTVTYNANNASATGSVPTDATKYTSSDSAVVKVPGDLALTNYTFVGWNTKSGGNGTYYSPGARIKMTADLNLYAVWESASSCPGSSGGKVLELSMKTNTNSKNLGLGESVLFGSTYAATLTGGNVAFTDVARRSSNRGETKAYISKSSGKRDSICFEGNDAMMTLYLDCALQEGDVIAFTASKSVELSFTTTPAYGNSIYTSSKSYTIPNASDLIGKKIIYVWRKTTSTQYVTALTITRPTSAYSITFDDNGADGGSDMTDVEDLDSGDDVDLAANTWTKTEHTFAGWKTDVALTYVPKGGGDEVDVAANDTIPDEATIKNVTGDITLTAAWKVNEYKVYFMVGIDASVVDGFSTYEYGEEKTLPTTVLRSGYLFDGWYANSSLTGDPVTQMPADATGTKYYYPKWKELSAKCLYITGDVIDAYNEVASDPGYYMHNDVKYTFGSGYDDDEDALVISSSADTSFVYLDPKVGALKEVQLHISDIADKKTADKGISWGFDDETGLVTLADLDNISDHEFSFRPASSNMQRFAFKSLATTLTIDNICVFYEPVTYSVTYSIGTGATGSAPSDATTYYYNDIVTVQDTTDTSIKKTGYTFRGWFDGTTFYVVGDKFKITRNTTLEAVWQNDSEGTTVTLTYFETSNHTSSKGIPDSKSYYLFGYPNSTMSSSEALTMTASGSATKGANSGTDMILDRSSELDIYANNATTETPATFGSITAISLNVKRYHSTKYGKISIAVGETTVVSDTSLVNVTNSAYVTWSFNNLANLSGKVIITHGGAADGQSPSSDHKCYLDNIAITVGGGSNNYTVSFACKTGYEALDGILPGDIIGVPSGARIGAPEDPMAIGYAFLGWYNDAACTAGNEIDFDDLTITRDTTIYAKWADNVKTFTGAAGTTAWKTAGNWEGSAAPNSAYPYCYSQVYIKAPAEMAKDTKEHVGRVDIVNDGSSNTGKLTINSGAMLIVYDKVSRIENWSTQERMATIAEDIYIGSERDDAASWRENGGLNGALIMGGYEESPIDSATVQFASLAYTKSTWTTSETSWGERDVNQYIGIPFKHTKVSDYKPYDRYTYTNVYLYEHDRWDNSWFPMSKNQDMYGFTGYDLVCFSLAPDMYTNPKPIFDLKGELASTENKRIHLRGYEGGVLADEFESMLANSWTAPINISAFEVSDFEYAEATIYMFNAGTAAEYDVGGTEWASNYSVYPGQYTAIPINDLKLHPYDYTGYKTIPSMQSFSIITLDNDGNSYTKHDLSYLTLDYKRLVYDPAVEAVGIPTETMHAPRRVPTMDESPLAIMLHVHGVESGLGDRIRLLEREDFSYGRDNGWETSKLLGIIEAPSLYAVTEIGDQATVAVPDVEGLALTFQAGEYDNIYTFNFEYDESEEPLYLLDRNTGIYTRVLSTNTYSFTTTDKNFNERFMLTRNYEAPAIVTGVESTTADSSQNGRAQKVLIKDHIYILRDGHIYDTTGKSVK